MKFLLDPILSCSLISAVHGITTDEQFQQLSARLNQQEAETAQLKHQLQKTNQVRFLSSLLSLLN